MRSIYEFVVKHKLHSEYNDIDLLKIFKPFFDNNIIVDGGNDNSISGALISGIFADSLLGYTKITQQNLYVFCDAKPPYEITNEEVINSIKKSFDTLNEKKQYYVVLLIIKFVDKSNMHTIKLRNIIKKHASYTNADNESFVAIFNPNKDDTNNKIANYVDVINCLTDIKNYKF